MSTNQVAEACGISPGNLYYHYTSKEAILRAIFEGMFAKWDAAFAPAPGRAPRLDDIPGFARANFSILWEHRFAYRELPALLRRDPVLQARYVEIRRRGFDGFRELFRLFAAHGLLTLPDDGSLEDTARLCWMVSEFWLSSLEISGRAVEQDAIEDGVRLMLRCLEPHRRTR